MPKAPDGTTIKNHSQTVGLAVTLVSDIDKLRYAEADEHGQFLTRAEWIRALCVEAVRKAKRKGIIE